MPNLRQPSLRSFNNFLTIVVAFGALYIILLPLWPAFGWWTEHQAPLISKPPTIATTQAIPDNNVLQIPSLGLNEVIHEGATKYTLHSGVWHRPGTGNPTDGGNTVLAGHRFTYHDPAVFYNLDKVKVGDPIRVYWEKQAYNYKVSKILTVAPSETAVEAPTDQPTLTIYTCTPVWTSRYRLVLIATPQEAHP